MWDLIWVAQVGSKHFQEKKEKNKKESNMNAERDSLTILFDNFQEKHLRRYYL